MSDCTNKKHYLSLKFARRIHSNKIEGRQTDQIQQFIRKQEGMAIKQPNLTADFICKTAVDAPVRTKVERKSRSRRK